MALAKQGGHNSGPVDAGAKAAERKGIKPVRSEDAGNGGVQFGTHTAGSGQNPKRPK